VFVALVIQHTKRMQRIISVSIRYSCYILKELEFLGTFRKTQISNFMKICPVGAGVFMGKDERTDRQKNMTKVTVALRHFSSASKTTYVYRRLPVAEFVPQASAKSAMFWCVRVRVCACLYMCVYIYIYIYIYTYTHI
jgi:hypothetical protein